MSSDLDIGDVEKEEFNSDYNSSSDSDSEDSEEQMEEYGQNEKNEEKEKDKENVKDDANNKDENNKNKEGEENNKDNKDNDSKKESKEGKSSDKKSKGKKINKLNSNKKSETKSSKDKNNIIYDFKYNENNNLLSEKNSNIQVQNEINRFYIPQYNNRLATLMNVDSEKSSEESDINEKERMKKENEIIKKEKDARIKFRKASDINFKIDGLPKNYIQTKSNEEMIYQKEKIKYLEQKNLELDRLNQMYYDLIRTTNLDIIKNDLDNMNYNNNLKLQSLDGINNNINQIPNPLNNFSQDNLDFAIKSYIDVERNKNIHNFNDSMIDINQKITNYLIDNCQEEKEKNKRLQDFKYEIGQKLDKIEYIQKQQKHDIDYIIKYGLHKNNDLNPIVGLFLDYEKPLPKLLKDIDEDDKYDKLINRKNFTPYKNFYLNGRYSNKDNEEDDISDKSNNRNRKILQRTGSYIFENRKNPFNYKLKENEEYEKLNPNIKKPFFDNKNQKIEIKKKNKYIDNTDYEDEEFQKFVAYKGRFFIPADFRFGKFKEKRKYNDKFKKSKNEIDFII